MSRTKVVIVIGQLGVGGGERQLFLLLKGIDRKKFDVTVISFNSGRGDYWEKPILDLGIRLVFVKRSRIVALRIVDLIGKLKQEKPEVLLCWTLHLNFFVGLAGKLLGVPRTIGSIRNDLFNPTKKDRPMHRWFGTKGVDFFIANSSKGKRDMVELLGVPAHKIKVINNAVVSDNLGGGVSEDRQSIREKLNLPLDGFLLLNVGRIEPSKNQVMLVRVLGRVCKNYPNVHGVFLGEGPSVPMLKEMAKELGVAANIHFPGKIPLAIQYFHAFDVMCHTGLADGMPNVLLEGAIRGLPLLSSRVNGSEDIIIDKETGFIVEYNDDENMAKAIVSLIENPTLSKELAVLGKQRVESEIFSVDTMVKAFELQLKGERQ